VLVEFGQIEAKLAHRVHVDLCLTSHVGGMVVMPVALHLLGR
jgi:hypothetical protein